MYSTKKIKEIAQKIKGIVDPKAIYLFGSYANGTPKENSDVDIAIIKDKVRDYHKLLFKIRKSLFHQGIPLDLILLQDKEYEEKKYIWGTIHYEININGLKLYESK